MDYFKKLSVKTVPQTIIDCPIRILEVAILQDSVDKDILGRIKFLNQSKSTVIGVFFDLEAKDIAGESVMLDDTHFVYQDMRLQSGDMYGNKIAINLPDNVRILSVEIDKVVFEDGLIWRVSESHTCEMLSMDQISLPSENLDRISDELQKFLPDLTYINYYYRDNDVAWLCSCGKLNSIDNEKCSFCGCDRNVQSSILTEEKFAEFCDNVNNMVAEEQEQEKAEKERVEEEHRKKEEERRRQEEEARRAEIDEKEHAKEARKRSRRQVEIGFVVVIVVLIASALFVYTSYRQEMKIRNDMDAEMIQKTDESISILMSLIGREADESNQVSLDFYEWQALSNVYFLGYTGNGSLSGAENYPYVIGVKWTSKDSMSKSDIQILIQRINQYYDSLYYKIDGAYIWTDSDAIEWFLWLEIDDESKVQATWWDVDMYEENNM